MDKKLQFTNVLQQANFNQSHTFTQEETKIVSMN